MRNRPDIPCDLEQLKRMNPQELSLLAVCLREALIDSVSKTGGHLASNLGAVELSIALARVFDTARDKIVWDVGHQAYVHKMLTGRWDAMKTLRCMDGISGFPKRSESIHDHYDAGHSGTSISAALGYAKARDLAGETHACVAIIGDGSLTAGVAYEGLNAVGAEKTPLIVVLNDNEMSISPNVGGMSKHLQHLRTSSPYLGFKRTLKGRLTSVPRLGKGLERARNAIKYTVMHAAVFEELGFKYFGPIDGHDIDELIEALEVARSLERPVLIHAVTVKGKGYRNAEQSPERYHGTGPFDPAIGLPLEPVHSETYTDIFGASIAKLAAEDERIVAITAAMTNGTGLDAMRQLFPGRVVDAGIAEQHVVSFAAGLALGGMRPVVAMYSTFLQRAYDQVLTEVCLQNLPVLFAIDRAGITGQDGETHHGQFDLAYLSSMPNMTVLAPKDGIELQEMLQYAIRCDGPCAIRFPKGPAVDLSSYGRTPMNGAIERITGSGKNAFLCTGSTCETALLAHELLKERGVESAVFNLRRVKPLATDRIRMILSDYENVLTLEDGSLQGGIGMQIAALAAGSGAGHAAVRSLGWPDCFIPHGTIAELKERFGLDARAVARQAEVFFEKTAGYPPHRA